MEAMKIGGYDVILTKLSSELSKKSGNARFCVLLHQQIIQNPKALNSESSRLTLAQSVIEEVHKCGGRFLEKDSDDNGNDVTWSELSGKPAEEWVERFIKLHIPEPSWVETFSEKYVSPPEIEDPRMRSVIKDALKIFDDLTREAEEEEEKSSQEKQKTSRKQNGKSKNGKPKKKASSLTSSSSSSSP
mmetsp:Transcript_13244/g.30829  ORF Transcript_13244/g.30829 Transcript_13244/m.30829 type:complete len:188 (+) Transcript_13244:90-653(+)